MANSDLPRKVQENTRLFRDAMRNAGFDLAVRFWVFDISFYFLSMFLFSNFSLLEIFNIFKLEFSTIQSIEQLLN